MTPEQFTTEQITLHRKALEAAVESIEQVNRASVWAYLGKDRGRYGGQRSQRSQEAVHKPLTEYDSPSKA